MHAPTFSTIAGRPLVTQLQETPRSLNTREVDYSSKLKSRIGGGDSTKVVLPTPGFATAGSLAPVGSFSVNRDYLQRQ